MHGYFDVRLALRVQAVEVFVEYFKDVEEESVRDNFVLIYELLDEMLDFGYPQTTESKILQEYITQEGHRLEVRFQQRLFYYYKSIFLSTILLGNAFHKYFFYKSRVASVVMHGCRNIPQSPPVGTAIDSFSHTYRIYLKQRSSLRIHLLHCAHQSICR